MINNKRHSLHPLYARYRAMFVRCYSKKCKAFKDYGGRGIRVCPEWEDFETYVSDMGPCPKGMEIDRIDNNKGYSKENCRWASSSTNSSNRRSSRIVNYMGDTLCLKEMAAKYSPSKI
jgi:hypothetical protein